MTIQRRWPMFWITTLAALAFTATVVVAGIVSRSASAPTTSLAGIESGFTPDGYPYLGSPSAPVTLVEFSDYLCGHCRNFSMQTAPLIIEKYVVSGKVRIVAHPVPGDEIRTLFVEAAFCAAEQGQYWQYHEALFEKHDHLRSITAAESVRAVVAEVAEEVGLDVDQFIACWESQHRRQFIGNSALAAYEAGIRIVPTFSVRGEIIVGARPYEEFERLIERAIAEAGQ